MDVGKHRPWHSLSAHRKGLAVFSDSQTWPVCHSMLPLSTWKSPLTHLLWEHVCWRLDRWNISYLSAMPANWWGRTSWVICAVSGLNNVKLEMSASKSLLLKRKEEQKQVRRQSANCTWKRFWVSSCQNKSWYNPAISTVSLIMSHLWAEHLCSTMCSLLQNGTVLMLGIDQQKTTAVSFASNFKCSSNQTLSGRSFPHSSSGLSTLSWAKPRCRLCECQNTWTMVEAERAMIRRECKAHVSSSTFSSKCWGRGSWAWAECQHSLQFNPGPWRNKLILAPCQCLPLISHSEFFNHFKTKYLQGTLQKMCFLLSLENTDEKKSSFVFCVRSLSTSGL